MFVPNQPTVAPFPAWAAAVKAAGGSAVVWPFKTGIYAKYYGQPAGKYDAQTYVTDANAGKFDVTRPQQGTADNAYFYVLAPDAAIADAPHTMTVVERAANATFVAMDTAATNLGLPSLAGLEHVVWAVGAAFVAFAFVQVAKAARGFRSVE